MDEYKNDIEKYLRGELTPAEMHALEKKALHDPFLADALEGVQVLNPDEFSADLNELQSRIDQHVRNKRNGGWSWAARIAAGLLLLGVSTYLIVLLSNRNEATSTGNLALNKKQEESSAPISEGIADSAVNKPSPSSTVQEEDGEQGKPKTSSRSEPVEHQQHEDAEPRPLVAPAASEMPQTDLEEKSDERVGSQEAEQQFENDAKQMTTAEDKDASAPERRLETESKKEIQGRSKRAVSKAPSYSHNVARKIIRGKVTFSEDGAGLPGVNVLVKDSNEGTVTDADGNYELAVSDLQTSLLFSFIGFTNKEVEVKSEELNVQLDADVSELSEVVVVGYAPKEQARLPLDPDILELATPEGGRKAFKQYLEKNLHYPEQALKNKVEGKVTIQFSIGTTGQLSDFKVIRGIGYGCDEEVIRLIKAGPKWSPTKRNSEVLSDRVRVRMRFALPDK